MSYVGHNHIKEESICQQYIESGDNEHNEKAEEKKLLVTFCAVKSNVLLGWLIGLGRVEVLEPEDVKEKMIALLDKNKDYYK